MIDNNPTAQIAALYEIPNIIPIITINHHCGLASILYIILFIFIDITPVYSENK